MRIDDMNMKKALIAARRNDEATDVGCIRTSCIRTLLFHMVTEGGLANMVGNYITSFAGVGLFNTIKTNIRNREILIATIAIIRSIVFVNVTGGHIIYYAPRNPNDVCQFWDEATAIVDGHLPLLLDIATSDKCTVHDDSLFHESTCTRYIHLMLICSNDEMYARRLPWKFWWMVDPDNRTTQSFRDMSCGYDTRIKANRF